MNNLLSAKNVFSDGLVMDFSPDNTKSTTLTSALNATLLTFNGNELQLQNDMGNGRVQTAYLPEGYVPVGTCEFGDIIYIVSYNPITNKSQIGCFPSPERNISSNKIENSLNVSLSSDEFISSNGEVKTTQIKKVLMQQNLNPGDKYIVFTEDSNGLFNESHISDVGNTDHKYGEFPKLLKIHLVTIDDKNKVDYLDSTVTWYEKQGKDYFINSCKDNIDTPDIDSYRNLLSSGYSTFQSKVSGKLALLIELEKIDTFSCTHSVYKIGKPYLKQVNSHDVYFQKYDVYFNINWTTDNYNINPSQFCLYNQKWTGINDQFAGQYILWEKEGSKYVKNLENSGIPIEFTESSFKENNISYYKKDLLRCYEQEQTNINYNEFVKNRSYSIMLDHSLDIIRIKQYLRQNETQQEYITYTSGVKNIDGSDIKIYNQELLQYENSTYKNIAITKVNINKDTEYGLPLEGQYYVNAANSAIIDNQKKYYTSYNNSDIEISPFIIYDDIINNYFGYPVTKKFASFEIPIQQEDGLVPDITNLIYNYEVAPIMPYGILPDLSVSNYINFSKIGSGEIELTQWKYYNTENTSTLTFGLNIQEEENMGVAGIVLEFIDNQGIAASYKLENNISYSGTFTDSIPLNNSFQNYKFTNKDINNKTLYHAGTQTTEQEESVYLPSSEISDYTHYKNGDTWEAIKESLTLVKTIPSKKQEYYESIAKNSNGEYVTVRTTVANSYTNDSGVIYSNFLYLVKITVQYCNKDTLDNYNLLDTENYKIFYRWFWTNTMFNEYYYNTQDFNTLQLELNMDLSVSYSSNENYNQINTENLFTTNDLDTENFGNNFGTIKQEISGTDNINVDIQLGLQETFNTFTLQEEILNNIKTYIYKGKSYITYENSEVTSINEEYEKDLDLLHPERLISKEEKPNIDNTNWDKDSYKNLYNWQLLTLKDEVSKDKDFEYINYKGEVTNSQNDIKLMSVLTNTTKTTLSYNAINFSNYYKYAQTSNLTYPVYYPLVHDISSASKYGFVYDNNKLVFKHMFHLTGGDMVYGGYSPHREIYLLTFNEDSLKYTQKDVLKEDRFEVSVRNRFDGTLQADDINTGFCAVRFYDYRYQEHNFVNPNYPDLKTAYILGSPENNIICNGVYSTNEMTTYYNIYSNIETVEGISTNIGNGIIIPQSSLGWNPIFPAYINPNKEIFIINNYYKAVNDELTPPWESYPNGLSGIEKLADIILNILTQTWIKSEQLYSQESQPQVLDIIYIKPYDLTYTYDLLFRTNIGDVNNSYITLNGIKFDSYLESITCQYDQQKESLNFKLKLSDILKNCPIQFIFTTKEIGEESQIQQQGNAFFKIITTEEPKYVLSYLNDTGSSIYYMDKNQEFQPYYSGNISIKNYSNTQFKVNEQNILYQTIQNDFEYLSLPFNTGFKYEDNYLNVIVKEDANVSIAQSYMFTVLQYLEHIKWNDIYKNIRISTNNQFFIYP